MNPNFKKPFSYFGIAAIVLAALFFLIKPSFQRKIFLGGNGKAWVNVAGPFASLHDSVYEIKVISKVGEERAVRLRGDFDWNPLLILCPSNSPVILCLYDCDVRLRIIKIHTNRSFRSLLSESALNWFIQDSSLLVEQGNADDWRLILSFLENGKVRGPKSTWMPTLDTGILRLYASRSSLAARMRLELSSIAFSYND